MAPDIAVRTSNWYADVIDLLAEPRTVTPIRELFALLHLHFEVVCVSWQWFDPDGSFGAVVDPETAFGADVATYEQWLTGEFSDCHPLLTWNERSGGLQPQTVARVPVGLVPRSRWMILEAPLRRSELEQQLSIVYHTGPGSMRAFVIGRGRRDFSDDDLVLAKAVQHSSRVIESQVRVLARLLNRPDSTRIAADVGMTGRELAVLQLVADGHSTRTAAHRLGCTPRTLEKHLERIYRKLGVSDRLNAVRLAHSLGLIGPRT